MGNVQPGRRRVTGVFSRSSIKNEYLQFPVLADGALLMSQITTDVCTLAERRAYCCAFS